MAEASADGVVAVVRIPLETLETFTPARPAMAAMLGRSIEPRCALVAAAIAAAEPDASDLDVPVTARRRL